MSELNKNRIALSEDELDQVVGGVLKITKVNGQKVVQRLDGNNGYAVIATYKVLTSLNTVSDLCQKLYWDMPGVKDTSMIEYLINNGHIAPM